MSTKKPNKRSPKTRQAGNVGVPPRRMGKMEASSSLRQYALDALKSGGKKIKTMSLQEIQQFVHELQVHQSELEKQNEDLRRTQEAFVEAHNPYAELFDFAPVGFVALDRQGVIREANLATCRFLGADRASLIGAKLEQFFSHQDRPRFRNHLQTAWTNEVKQVSDGFTLTHGHAPVIIKIKSLHGLTKDGSMGSVLQVVLTDVTDMEMARRESDAGNVWVNSILESAMDAIITVDEQQNILLFNKAAEDMFGCSAQEVQGQSIARFIPQRYRDGHFEQLRRFAREEVTKRRMGRLGEIVCLRANGSEFPAESSISQCISAGKKLMTVMIRDITDRKVVERGMRVLNRQHQLLLHSAGEGIYGVDSKGYVTFFNRAAENMTGWKQEEVRGEFIHKLIHHTKPDGSPYLWEECHLREVLLNDVEKHVEDEVLWRKDGSGFHADYRSSPIREEKGQLIGAVVIFRDITERKEHHLQLLALANRNQALIDAIPDMIVEVDLHKKIFWMNREAVKFFGGSALGKEASEIFMGEPELYKRMQSFFQGDDHVLHLESWLRGQDGESRLLEWWCRGLKDAQGKIMGALATARDVTERRREAERLIESERRFRTMVKHLPDGAIFTDGRNLIVNEAVVRMTGYSMTELSTLDDWFRLLHGPDESIIKKLYVRDKQAGFESSRLLPIRRKDGALRYVEFARYGWDKGEVWLLHDVTDQHESRIALLESKDALEKNQGELRSLTARLLTAQEDERRRISRDLHDDLNQRLAVLALKIQTGQQGLDKSGQNYLLLQQLYDEVSDLSDDIRHLAYQLHPSVLDDLGLKLALRSLIDDFAKWEKIPITFNADDIPGMLPQEISSCLYRLAQESLRNISKYARATQVTVTLSTLNRGIQLNIQDDGVGFELDASTLKKGLGLIGMQERVRLVNGRWSVRTNPGDGVTISAWVPFPQESK